MDDSTAPAFRALADPSRRLLLDRLFERDGQSLGELTAYLPDMTRFGVMRHLDVPDEHFDHALFLYNAMFDPREILDLISTGLPEEEAISRLTAAYYGALQGWAGA